MEVEKKRNIVNLPASTINATTGLDTSFPFSLGLPLLELTAFSRNICIFNGKKNSNLFRDSSYECIFLINGMSR